MAQGRGAWTLRGKDNNSVYYEYIVGKPIDGGNPKADSFHSAVHSGVEAIQSLLNAAGATWSSTFDTRPLTTDGEFGPLTSAKVKYAQGELGTVADGQVGVKTMKALLLPSIRKVQNAHKIPGDYLCGLIRWESNWDPGAVGYVTDNDHGLVQINSHYNPAVTVALAFNPEFAIEWAGKRLAASLVKYGDWEPAIASYNSPESAAKWKETGSPPNTAIYKYVTHIMQGNA